MIPWTCPPVWPAYLFGGLATAPVMFWLGRKSVGWKVYVTRHFDHSQTEK